MSRDAIPAPGKTQILTGVRPARFFVRGPHRANSGLCALPWPVFRGAAALCLTAILSGLPAPELAWAQQPEKTQHGAEKQKEEEPQQSEGNKRIELNLLGKTDAAAGESRRNENIQFNLVDNNALKELNVRLGTTATIVREFSPGSNYFGAEFGNAPASLLSVPAGLKRASHGSLQISHLNSVFSARSFFQVGD